MKRCPACGLGVSADASVCPACRADTTKASPAMITPGAGRTSGYASAGMAVGLLLMMGAIVAVCAAVGAAAGFFVLGAAGAVGGGIVGGAAGVYFVYTIA